MSGELLIDISAAVNQGAGIGRYARELTRELIPMLDPSSTTLWYAEDDNPAEPALPDEFPWSQLPLRKTGLSRLNVDRLFVRQSFPGRRLLRVGKPANVYSPDFTVPPAGNARTHITVHDLAWFHPEARTPEPLAKFLAPVVERSVRAAATVFTVSETIREEIIERYRVPGDRVIVAPNAAAAKFHDADLLSDDEIAAMGIRKPFLLAVGTIEPRKNLGTLFEALTLLPATMQLVVVGRSGWDSSSILGRIDELGLGGRVIRLGYLPDDALPGLMAAAAAVVYPSCYEGFGLPVIESMATGVPVVASDLPVFREIGGDAVVYFDPRKPDDLAGAIEYAMSSASSEQSRALRKQRAARFDWQESARIVANRIETDR